MSIYIERERCVGCGACVEAFPGNLIKRDVDGKAKIKRPQECWGCASCLKACHFGDVEYYLGADIGGRGATMTVEKEGDFARWIIRGPGKDPVALTVDRRNANKY
ncbi:MAG: ferredoxin family protein [Planctomycetia bacterium]|nr:ferredoxin family protein [Planctomycetia bacterium]